MYKHYILFLSLWLLQYIAFSANLPFGFVEQVLVDSLNPVAMTIDHHDNIWIVEKHGVVRIYDPHQGLLADPFIQINVDDYNERGLLGIALHPDFDLNPYVYLYYTVPGGNHNRLSRFLANGLLAVPASEEIIFELDTLAGFVHNGGAMLFGPDGKLYIATGEAAHPPFSQDLNSLHGKILRLNEDGTIPTDNPFYQQLNGDSRAIWALGLRNPFALAYDEASSRFYAIDVGGGEFEEINSLSAAMNYGWPQIEGPLSNQQTPTNYVDPVYAYDHQAGCSIVGAAFYPASSSHFPETYAGQFFFADYCDGYIKSYDPIAQTSSLFADQINRPLAIAFSHETGKLYYLTRAGIGGGSPADNTFTQQGQLWEVSFLGTGAPFVSVHPQSTLVSLGEEARFLVQASGAYPLTYQWLQDGVPINGSTDSILSFLSPSLADSGSFIQCIVSNSEGADTSQVAILKVTSNQRPLPMIRFPSDGDFFRAGDTISFGGTAIDPEEGILEESNLSWLLVFHHDEHTHPGAGPFVATDSASWIVPTVNETDTNVWYRLHLNAIDTMGLAQTTTIDLRPKLAPISLLGPAGVMVNIDGRRRALPYTFYSQVGLNRVVEALPISIVGDSLYRFLRWANAATETIWEGSSGDEGLILGLEYEAFVLGNGAGVWGSYYNDSSLGFETLAVLEQPEAVLSFLWGDDSPDDELVHQDFFTASWEGEIQAVFDERYIFYIRSDDGVRLWIDDQLIIDQWVPQAPTERQGSIQLEKGKRYAFRLEYFEMQGGAEMVLNWSSPSTTKEIIPSRQLYYNPILANHIEGKTWIDQNQNGVLEQTETLLANIIVGLYQSEDSSLVGQSISDQNGAFRFEAISPDSYYLHFLSQSSGRWLNGIGTLDVWGRSEAFLLAAEQTIYFPASFSELDSSWLSAFAQLKVYPQPTEDQLQISFTHLYSQEIEIKLIDPLGKCLLMQKQQSELGANHLQLPTHHLSPGLYILQLKADGGLLNRKILKL
ncbi:MAG: PQQ-dependent sugar dehydrogenase [Bacteroidia bacterium]